MAEHIKRETVINHLDACMDTIWKPEIVALKCFVEGIPAADVAPVRHGSWKYHDDINFWRCSCCGVNAPIAGDFMQLKTNYCSYCGARMDGAE